MAQAIKQWIYGGPKSQTASSSPASDNRNPMQSSSGISPQASNSSTPIQQPQAQTLLQAQRSTQGIPSPAASPAPSAAPSEAAAIIQEADAAHMRKYRWH